MEFINRHDIMEYAPLHYPLPRLYFKLEIGRSSDESRGDAGDVVNMACFGDDVDVVMMLMH